jgi:hypothetical protein
VAFLNAMNHIINVKKYDAGIYFLAYYLCLQPSVKKFLLAYFVFTIKFFLMHAHVLEKLQLCLCMLMHSSWHMPCVPGKCTLPGACSCARRKSPSSWHKGRAPKNYISQHFAYRLVHLPSTRGMHQEIIFPNTLSIHE